MLNRLSIRNFALIDAVDLRLDEGLTVLSGETGAGKSILFSAVELLMGQRASADLVRRDADEAMVQGVIVPSATLAPRIEETLREAGVPFDGELIVRRQVSRSGRNRAWLNDQIVTISLIEDVVSRCIDILGQHQHLSLLEQSRQERLIDQSGGYAEHLERMRVAYDEWQDATRRLRRLADAREERHERMEFLRFQLAEISALELREGEFEELERTVTRLRYSEKLRRAAEAATHWLLEAEHAASTSVGEAESALQSVAEYDERIPEWTDRLQNVRAIVDDVARDVERLLDDSPDVDEIDEVLARHEQIKKAMRRFGADEAGLIERLAELGDELETLESYEESLAEAEARVEKTHKAAIEAADGLDRERQTAADSLFGEVEKRLALLGMRHAKLVWTSTESPDVTRKLRRSGWAGKGLYFSANPGEEPRPIERVASGGELSRLLLGLKSVLLERDPVDSYLFDEIDTGIGGETAVIVGDMLRTIGEGRQVLCITHLPQIAGKAHHQLLVEKRIETDRTTTTIRALSPAEREAEITRMLGGAAVGTATRAHARELLGQLH